MLITTNGLSLGADDFAPTSANTPSQLPILLVMGLGMPRSAWPMPLIDRLRAAGHRVIRFDNRDIGESSKLEQWGRPNVALAAMRHALHMRVHAPYTLDDMAHDTTGLLDALGIARVHVVGVSMGGMIGQLLAADSPSRVASFTCIMSSSGARHLPGPAPAARWVLMSRPRGRDPQAIVDHYVRVLRVIGSPAFQTPDDQLRERIRQHLLPWYFPLGTARQLVGIAASGDRSSRLAGISCPVQIIHGRADPLVPLPAAYDLESKIAGARLEIIDGMGHDMPEPLFDRLAGLVLDNLHRVTPD